MTEEPVANTEPLPADDAARHNPPGNGFLRSLSAKSYRLLQDHLTLVQLTTGVQLQRNGDPIDWVYFPISCLLSLISTTEAGQTIETSMAGNEGAVGVVEACGNRISNTDCIVQVDGAAWRCPQKDFRDLAMSDPDFNGTAWRLAQLQLMESRQSALCEALHPVEQRFARWMLESTDRSGGRNPLPMTQEFLATMLGVQRTTVSGFAARLQREGSIAYARGKLRILNKTSLEARACECRRLTQRERARLSFHTTIVHRHERPVEPALHGARLPSEL